MCIRDSYRVKEVRVPEIGTAFPLRVAHLEARQRMLADTVDFIDDPDAPEEIAEDDNEDDLEDDEDAAAEAVRPWSASREARGSTLLA